MSPLVVSEKETNQIFILFKKVGNDRFHIQTSFFEGRILSRWSYLNLLRLF